MTMSSVRITSSHCSPTLFFTQRLQGLTGGWPRTVGCSLFEDVYYRLTGVQIRMAIKSAFLASPEEHIQPECAYLPPRSKNLASDNIMNFLSSVLQG